MEIKLQGNDKMCKDSKQFPAEQQKPLPGSAVTSPHVGQLIENTHWTEQSLGWGQEQKLSERGQSSKVSQGNSCGTSWRSHGHSQPWDTVNNAQTHPLGTKKTPPSHTELKDVECQHTELHSLLSNLERALNALFKFNS